MEIDRRTAMRQLAGAAAGSLLWDHDEPLRQGLCGDRHVAIDGFQPYRFTDSRQACHPLYLADGGGPPVLLLHELPGLVRDDLAAARRIADLGYRVLTPLFFGTPGGESTPWINFRNTLRVCGRRQFACSQGHATSPHIAWLRELCRHAACEWPHGKGVGVIGMCLTGAFPVALLQESCVAAAVLCQPTLPFNFFTLFGWFTDRQALAVHPADLAKAKSDSHAPILGLRYTQDGKSPRERFERLAREFGPRFFRMDLAGKHHSTLGSGFCQAGFDEVTALLNAYVRETPATGVPSFPCRSRACEHEVPIDGCETLDHHA